MRRVGVVLTCLAAIGAAPPAVSPDPKSLLISPADQELSRRLVEKLGSTSFEEREAAQRELAKMGRRALPALLDALETSGNPEIRSRCRRLVSRAEAEDIDARIRTFLADGTGKFEHDLPGWAEFREAAGDDTGARALFGEIVREAGNRTLLESIDRPPEELFSAITDYKEKLYTKMYPRRPGPGKPTPRAQTPTIPEIAALYLADTYRKPDARPEGPVPLRSTIRGVLTHTKIRTAIQPVIDGDEPQNEAFRRLLVAWLESRTDPDELYSATGMVNSLKFVEGLGVVERAATADGLLSSRRAYAITALARLGGKSRLPTLEKLLQNAVIATRLRVNSDYFDIQIRDVALAMCLRLTDQDPADYGFRIRSSSTSEATKFSYSNHYFRDEEDRKAAFEKWAAWNKSRGARPGKK